MLDRDLNIILDLNTSKIERDKTVYFYNTDKNIFNIYVKFKRDGTILTKEEVEKLSIRLFAKYKKTYYYKDATLLDTGKGIVAFKVETNRIGRIICQLQIKEGEGKELTSDPFPFYVKPDITTGLNEEIEESEDYSILKNIIDEVKNLKIIDEIKNLKDEVKNIIDEVKNLKKDDTEIKNDINALTEQYNTVKSKIESVENRKELNSVSIDENGVLSFYSRDNNVICSIDLSSQLGIEKKCIQDGLCLFYDFTETPENPTTVYDKICNLPIYNKNYTAENYTSNGVYLVNGTNGNCFKVNDGSVGDWNYQQLDSFTTFLNKVKEGKGLTVEYFGQYLPQFIYNCYNNGMSFSSNGTNAAYLTNVTYMGNSIFKYLNSSDIISNIVIAQNNIVTLDDGSTINSFSADNNADKYIHLVFSGDENGNIAYYLNGNIMTKGHISNFKTWSYDEMLKPNYSINVCHGGHEDTNRLLYPSTSVRIYNRGLTKEEIRNNLNYEISRTTFVTQ